MEVDRRCFLSTVHSLKTVANLNSQKLTIYLLVILWGRLTVNARKFYFSTSLAIIIKINLWLLLVLNLRMCSNLSLILKLGIKMGFVISGLSIRNRSHLELHLIVCKNIILCMRISLKWRSNYHQDLYWLKIAALDWVVFWWKRRYL